jgi:hypothetical protein
VPIAVADYVACVFDFIYLSIAQISLYRTNPSYSASETQILHFIICRLYKLAITEQAQFTLQVRLSF